MLSLFTIFYNIAEGVISMSLGYADETLSLFGFGADSFIEVISGIGIAIMIHRIRRSPDSSKTSFEITALKITGTAFYLLSAGLLAGIILNLISHHRPETTLWNNHITGFHRHHALADECKKGGWKKTAF
jgi:hypothetical protein